MKDNHPCPYCNGTGHRPLHKGSLPLDVKRKCLELRRKGLSYHKIAPMVGMKNGASVWNAVKTLQRFNKVVKIKPS